MANILNRIKNSPMVKDVTGTSLLSIVGKSLGFAIPLFIAAWLGISQDTDAFFFAYSIIFVLRSLIQHIFETLLVPLIAVRKAKGQDLGIWIGHILISGSIVVACVLVLMMTFVRPLTQWATAFSPSTIDKVVAVIFIMLPVSLIGTWTSTLNGALNAHKVFQVPALSPGVRSLVVILLCAVRRHDLTIETIAWSFAVGELIRFAPSLFFYLRRVGKIRFSLTHITEVSPFLKFAGMQALAVLSLNMMAVVDQSMASWIGDGSLSGYAYALRLYGIPSLMMTSGITPVILAYWSHDFSHSTKEFTWVKIRHVMMWFTLITIAGATLLYTLRTPLAIFAFGHGQFPENEIPGISNIFGLLLIGLPFHIIHLLSVRILIIRGRHAFYMIFSILKLVLDVMLNLLFMHFLGIMGIALATTVLNVIYAFLFAMEAKKCTLVPLSALPPDDPN